MRFWQYIVAALVVCACVAFGLTFYYKGDSDTIRNFNFEKDFKQVETLFHKGDNWYWMISDYSRKVGYDLDFALRYQSSSLEEKRHDLITKVLEVEDKVAGFMAYYPKSPYTWQFLFLLVDQDFRGKGIAKQLLSYAVEDMLRLGAIKIDLVTRVDNARAQGLYQNFGFKQGITTEEHVYMSWHKGWDKLF